jgi:hypothetical protein
MSDASSEIRKNTELSFGLMTIIVITLKIVGIISAITVLSTMIGSAMGCWLSAQWILRRYK